MIRKLALAAALLTFATTVPAPPAAAQDPFAVLGGAIVGGAIGGAATGRGGGAIVGAIIGGTTAAVISREAELRSGGYYWWHGRCYYRYPQGDYVQVRRDSCY